MKRTRHRPRRPLSITLTPSDIAFIESCVALREFRSVDELIDLSLAFYHRRLEAIQAYSEDQVSKGCSRAEVLESIQRETHVAKDVPGQRRKRAERVRPAIHSR